MPATDLLRACAEPPEVLRALAAVPGLRVVGGWLRGAYFGRATTDLDLTCELPLAETVEQCARVLGAEPFALNERYPTRRLLAGDYTIDISQLTGGNVDADIARRDYTVNTLMARLDRLGASLPASDLEGHPQALADLDSRTLRMVSAASLADDPLRLLRGYRFCATEGFIPYPETRAAWKSLAGKTRDAAAERIHEELLRWFAAEGGVHDTLAICSDDGVLWQVFPTLQATTECVQAEGVDVWSHTLECLRHLETLRNNLPPELESQADNLAAAWDEPVSGAASAGTLTRLALLLHDSAKPATRAVDEDGKLSFYDHQNIGADLLLPELQALKFAGAEIDYLLLLVREHLRLGFYTGPEPTPPRLVYRYIRKLGRATPLMLLHSIADCMATRGDWAVPALQEHIAGSAQILAHYYAADGVAAPPLLLNGDEIMEVLKLQPGRVVGELKDALLEATASGEVVTRDEAIGFVRRELRARRDAEQSAIQ
jgi:tRNA nucleotidyltransferase/poly(A) polymerase